MRKPLVALAFAGLSSFAVASDLRIYPSFAEVRQAVTLSSAGSGVAVKELTFSREVWNSVMPGSLGWWGTPLAAVRLMPVSSPWLTAQQGKRVMVLRSGQAAQAGTLVRAADLLVQLDSVGYVNVEPSQLVFPELPPRGWQVDVITVRLEGQSSTSVSGQISYRTTALRWNPRYELLASGSQARLTALAELRNGGPQAVTGQEVELYAGDVRTPQEYGGQAVQQMNQGAANTAIPGGEGLLSSRVDSLGELRGLQRYMLKGSLAMQPGETLSVPFLQTKLSNFTRYNRIESYFDRQARSGSASRHYKFAADQALPAGTLAVREDGALVGSVTLPAAQAGKGIDLNLGVDPELRYLRQVKQLAQEKGTNGKVISTTYQVNFTLISTKSTAVRALVREQVYGRTVSVDGQAAQEQQTMVERRIDVPAGKRVSLSFKVKISQ